MGDPSSGRARGIGRAAADNEDEDRLITARRETGRGCDCSPGGEVGGYGRAKRGKRHRGTKHQWDLDRLRQHANNKETTKTVLENIYLQGAGAM